MGRSKLLLDIYAISRKSGIYVYPNPCTISEYRKNTTVSVKNSFNMFG